MVARRRAGRQALIEQARTFVAALDPALDVRGVVVFGSVARGDWNDRSDVDVLVVAAAVPTAPLARLDAVGMPPGRVEPVVWSVDDWTAEHRRRNPIATEAVKHGVWLLGSPSDCPGGEVRAGQSRTTR